jgi:hypothetical protein
MRKIINIKNAKDDFITGFIGIKMKIREIYK